MKYYISINLFEFKEVDKEAYQAIAQYCGLGENVGYEFRRCKDGSYFEGKVYEG